MIEIHKHFNEKLSEEESKLVSSFYISSQLLDYEVSQGSRGFQIQKNRHKNDWECLRLIVENGKIFLDNFVATSQHPIPEGFVYEEFKSIKEAINKLIELI